MSSVCDNSISWCCFVVTFFRFSSYVPLLRGIPIVLPVFGCMFRQFSGVPPVFRCFAGLPCSVVPCSGVHGFIVCPRIRATARGKKPHAFIIN